MKPKIINDGKKLESRVSRVLTNLGKYNVRTNVNITGKYH
jgi:hypothetical protein